LKKISDLLLAPRELAKKMYRKSKALIWKEAKDLKKAEADARSAECRKLDLESQANLQAPNTLPDSKYPA
jgi:hypothetical protein